MAGEPFAARTPTGLPLNPLLWGVEVVLLWAFRPEFWVLRVPPAFSGALTVVLTYALMSQPLGRSTAVIAAALLATLPIAVGYSRFGWDTSMTPLACLVAISFATRGRAPGEVLAFAACLVVHPANAFLARCC